MLASGGIALAVPASAVEEFLKNGPRPCLGVTVRVVRMPRRRGVGLLIMSIEKDGPAEQASLLIGDILIGTPGARFTETADLSDAIGDADARLTLHFLRGDNTREREVVISFSRRHAREAA